MGLIYNFELAFMGTLVVYLILWAILRVTQDDKEPRPVDTWIPFVSPLIKMNQQGSKYFHLWSYMPMYTLRLPGIRLYVANSTAVIQPLQQETINISFEPILLKVAAGIMGFSQTGLDIVSKVVPDEHNFLHASGANNNVTLAPGPRLHALNRRAVGIITESLNQLAAEEAPLQVGLHEWIGRQVIKTASEAMYGPDTPFKDPANVKAWHQFGAGFVPLLVNFAPQITARKYVQAREILVKAFERYFENKGYADEKACPLIKDRYELFVQRGLPPNDIARHEVGSSLALLINTIEAVFWLVYHLFSNPAVLTECRRELSEAVTEDNGECTVDLAYIKTSCPVFLSTVKETLRFRGINVAARIVLNDTLIGEQYLLKKGGVVLIPATVQHKSESVYGGDAAVFDHRRFVRAAGSKPKRFDPLAFRVFGGGSVVCPGRHFANTEILALATMIALQFDVRPRHGSWPTPTVENSNPGISFMQADSDIEVDVSPRDTRMFHMTVTRSEESAAASKGDLVATDV